MVYERQYKSSFAVNTTGFARFPTRRFTLPPGFRMILVGILSPAMIYDGGVVFHSGECSRQVKI